MPRKEAVAAEFDREFVVDTFRPLSAAQRRQWNRIRAKTGRAKPGRPRVGGGVERVSVTIERSLLKLEDREAKRLGISRARLIAMGLQEGMRKPRKRAA